MLTKGSRLVEVLQVVKASNGKRRDRHGIKVQKEGFKMVATDMTGPACHLSFEMKASWKTPGPGVVFEVAAGEAVKAFLFPLWFKFRCNVC